MPRYSLSIDIQAPIEKVYAFHLDPQNLVRIAPPSSKMELVSTSEPEMKLGTRVVVRSFQAGLHIRMEAEVTAIDPPHFFQDRQVSGPFAEWVHSHRFEEIPGGTRLTDEVEYTLPMGALSGLVMGRKVGRDLAETFSYRQQQTQKLLEAAWHNAQGPQDG